MGHSIADGYLILLEVGVTSDLIWVKQYAALTVQSQQERVLFKKGLYFYLHSHYCGAHYIMVAL